MKDKKAYDDVNWEFVKDNYPHILNLFVSNLPVEGNREDFQHSRSFFTEDWTASKIKQFCYKYRKALDLGKECEATFYNICNEIWRESSHESLKSGRKTTSGEIETGEND